MKDDAFKLNDGILENFKTNYGDLQSKEIEASVTKLLKKLAGRLDVKNADERTTIATRKAMLESEEFKEQTNNLAQEIQKLRGATA